MCLRPIPLATYRVTEVNGQGLSDHPAEFYRTEGFDYLITTSYISNLDLVDRQQDKARDAFYRSLHTAFELVQEFRPHAGEPTAVHVRPHLRPLDRAVAVRSAGADDQSVSGELGRIA